MTPTPIVEAESRDLLPCPFCGGEPSTHTHQDESLWSHNIVTKTVVSCGECDIQFDSEPGYEFEAPEAWNRRAAPPIPTEGGDVDLRAAMQEACDLLAERIQGSPARSAGHNARLCLESALNAPSQPHGGAGAGGWVLVPAEITRPMRHATWKADYLDAGATEAEAAVLAANREADPEEVEDANAAYRAMLAARPSPPPAAGPTQEAVEDGLPADWGSPKEWFAHIYRFKDRLDSLTDERNFPAHLLDAVQEIDMLLDEVIAAAPESLLALFNGDGQ